jgi:hypothetical protein
MLDTVVDRANQLGMDEPKQFVFMDRSGRLIGDVELPGVDVGNETPQELDNNEVEHTDLEDTPNDDTQEEVTPNQAPRILSNPESKWRTPMTFNKWNHKLFQCQCQC